MRKIFFALLAILMLGSSLNFSFAASVLPSSVNIVPKQDAVKSAIAELKSLSRKERKTRIKAIKEKIKDYKAAKKEGREPSTNTLLLVILAILLPPLAVYLYEGEINNRFWISLLLTLLFWLPGVIYALVLILGNY